MTEEARSASVFPMSKWVSATGVGIIFGILGALAALVSPGMVPSEGLGPPVNLFWSAIYGIGWELTAPFSDVRAPTSQFVGGKLWPLIVLFFMSAGFSWAWITWKAKRRRLLFVALVTFLLWLPVKWVARSPLRHLPNYTATLAVFY